jgi:hypothetical protein
MNTQEKEYKRVADLIMRKDMWEGHYEVVKYGTGAIVYLKVSYELDSEIRMLLGGVLTLHIGDIIATWARENLLEKCIIKTNRKEFGMTGVLYRL